ncbi:hypothetical protein GCM10028862_03090 [Luteimonas pelagia]
MKAITIVLVGVVLATAAIGATTSGPGLRHVGPSLVPGTTMRASVSTDEDTRLPLLTYERVDGRASTTRIHANELIVAAPESLHDPRTVIQDAIRASGLRLRVAGEIPGEHLFLLRIDGATPHAPGAILERLRPHLPDGFAFEPNFTFRASSNQDLLGRGLESQWALRNVGAFPGAFGRVPDADVDGYEALVALVHNTRIKHQLVVAVMDSGLETGHPSLRESVWTNAKEIPGNRIDDDGNGYVDDVNGWDFLSHWGQVPDFTGHGTHVAGIIASNPPDPSRSFVAFGLAPIAKIMPLRVLGKGAQSRAPLFAVLEALAYARNQGVDVINMSFETDVGSPILEAELRENRLAGIHQVAAAGNGLPDGVGKDITKTPVFPCAVVDVVCVAATGADDALLPSSNFGVRVTAPGVAIAAPGEEILSTCRGGTYCLKSGTSMATPMVAAVFAVAKALYPEETYEDRLARVLGAADRLEGMAMKIDEGRRLNAYQSLFHQRPAGVSIHDQSPYCLAWITDPVSGQLVQRWRNHPYANWREPGVDGEEGEPFRICTAHQLMAIRDEDLSKRFVLAQDIHWSLLGPAGGYPIGGQPRKPGEPPLRFTGRFRGDGHAIIGMRFVGAATGGLFAHLDGRRASIDRLRLRQVHIDVSDAAGAFAVRMDDGGLRRVEAEGVIRAGRVAGGIVGEQFGGQLQGPFFEGLVASKGTAGGISGYTGALVRERFGTILQAHFNGTVEAPVAGGLIGHADRGSWSGGHALAVVRGAVAGGAAGKVTCGALVDQATAEGFIDSDGQAGGIAGRIGDARIRDSYASVGYDSIGKTTGGAVGVIADGVRTSPQGPFLCTGTHTRPKPSTLASVFYDTSSSPPGAGGEGRSDQQLRDQTTYPAGWRDPQLRRWEFRPGYMAALTGMPRSFKRVASSGSDRATAAPE